MRASGRNGFLAGAAAAPSAIDVAETLYKTPALVTHRVRCGKPNCRCACGELHGPYWYRRWREGGRQRRQYVSARDAQPMETALAEWRRLRPPAYAMRQQLAELRRLLRMFDAMGV